MKIQEKHIMGPLLAGGLIISLYFTITACNRVSAVTAHKLTGKPTATSHALQNTAPVFCIRLIKKFITN